MLYVSFPGVALNITVRELRSDGFHPLYSCDASGGDMGFSPSLDPRLVHCKSCGVGGGPVLPGRYRKLRNCSFMVCVFRVFK